MRALPRGRPKKERPPGLPVTKKPRKTTRKKPPSDKQEKSTKDKKTQIRRNRANGLAFENRIVKLFKEYLAKRDIEAAVYKLPSGLHYNQAIDILIDSKDFGYIGCECKSIDDSRSVDKKINIKRLGSTSPIYGHQFKKQHEFLKESGRYGIIVFWFKKDNLIVLVPHQYIYDKMQAGYANVTISELISIGYVFDKENTGSLKMYIRQKCKTG